MPLPLYPWERDPVPILQEAGWAPELVLMGAENVAPTGIRSPTIQLVVSRYTNYAILAHKGKAYHYKTGQALRAPGG